MVAEVDRVTITTVVENSVDMLLPDEGPATRLGLIEHFDPRAVRPQAENGIAFLVRAERRGRSRTVLFDTSLTAEVLLHNFRAVGQSPNELSAVVLSHGHPDHHGGLAGLLDAVPHPLPVLVHPDAFAPRYLRLPGGEIAPHYNHELTPAGIESRGGAISANTGPVEVIDGVLATGAIERGVDFERSGEQGEFEAGLFRLDGDGAIEPDAVPDDQALVVNVGEAGLVVLTGCSHAGVINSVRAAQEVTGVERVLAVMGGFHLGFPGVPSDKVDHTIAAMKQIGPRYVAPMHCTGMAATARFMSEMPERFLHNLSGTTVRFAARDRGG
jgi:7,8-dihydropterin-6-yl-methyl-4-(beta-D-ribofuranosyl)aminobenzene 5'-phosphate synthase